ncbi:hypothetical protein CFOL_v3_32283 [Cephalotus follicularis]|uniref:Uncharacterized protein n=1 Tax=Cephalotus follicularis TaxID=3775 RepID=A0A1Q3D8T3_CEPFO|nr:hypothetical protein CFOL_v3_32283 [Cephalotus follicularis]
MSVTAYSVLHRFPQFLPKALSRAGLEPAPLGAKDRPSELPFILIATLVTLFVSLRLRRLHPGVGSPDQHIIESKKKRFYLDLGGLESSVESRSVVPVSLEGIGVTLTPNQPNSYFMQEPRILLNWIRSFNFEKL